MKYLAVIQFQVDGEDNPTPALTHMASTIDAAEIWLMFQMASLDNNHVSSYSACIAEIKFYVYS